MRKITRRTALALGIAACTLAGATGSFAQDKMRIRFSTVFNEQDIRANIVKQFSNAIADDFDFEAYYNGTMFKQGTEIIAIQRGNLEMSDLPPQDIANLVPEWSLLTAAYLFRDADHLTRFFESDAGQEMKGMAEDKLNIKILGPIYNGTRQVGLRIDKEIKTPADMNGVKLRMPGGESWQFLGQALGANPTPMAYAEVYTGLQIGAIDGQDNPLSNVQAMKFYEVMSQIVETSHILGYTLLTVSKDAWDKMSPEQQQKFQAAADAAIAANNELQLQKEVELVGFMKEHGLKVYKPDVDAFRAYAQDMYKKSDIAKNWPEGMLERINAL